MGEVQVPSPSIFEPQQITPIGCELPEDWTLEERYMCDLEMLLAGAFHPLEGFLCKNDYLSVLKDMRLTTGEVWPIPIVLPIPKAAVSIDTRYDRTNTKMQKVEVQSHQNQIVKLRDKLGTVVAQIDVSDIYEPDLTLEMEKTLGTTEPSHPYVQHLLKYHSDCYYIGGKVTMIKPVEHFNFTEYRFTASESRAWIKQQGWEAVVGFQTRNPMHRSHFELTQQALQEVSSSLGKEAYLLLTPAIGPTQPGDVELAVRVRAYKQILLHYGTGKVQMALLPIAMRMAGPREAVWHALIRKNYGCTHFIVGRDHAGPSSKRADGKPFYGPYDAHKLIQSVQDELGVLPVLGRAMMYVGEELGGYVQEDAVPENVVGKNISGTELRKMLQNRSDVPEWYSFPEVVAELKKFYRPKSEVGLCIYFTGLPCSGKSTLANALQAIIEENEKECRAVTLLDADVVRTHLSKGLGFSREDRSLNVRRIGYVASEITKHGGICLVANIAPYEEDRMHNREMITRSGAGYVEVYVSTPLQVCEERDVKELYRKARQGIIKQFTGISDPYQVPENAELVINSSNDVHGKVKYIIEYLKQNAWISA